MRRSWGHVTIANRINCRINGPRQLGSLEDETHHERENGQIERTLTTAGELAFINILIL